MKLLWHITHFLSLLPSPNISRLSVDSLPGLLSRWQCGHCLWVTNSGGSGPWWFLPVRKLNAADVLSWAAALILVSPSYEDSIFYPKPVPSPVPCTPGFSLSVTGEGQLFLTSRNMTICTVFYGCPNKLPQSVAWVTHIYYLTVPKVRSQMWSHGARIRVSEAAFLPGGPRGGSASSLGWNVGISPCGCRTKIPVSSWLSAKGHVCALAHGPLVHLQSSSGG